MSKFKVLMLGLLTIGCGFCTNSVVFGQYDLTGGDSTPGWVSFGAAANSITATNLLSSSAPAGEVADPDHLSGASTVNVIGSGGAPSGADFGETTGGSINGTAPDLSVRTSAMEVSDPDHLSGTSTVDVIGSGGEPSGANFGEATGSINDPALDLSSRTIAVEIIDNDSVERVSDPDLSIRTTTERVATFGSHVNTPGVTPSKIRVNAVRQAAVSHAPTSRNETNDRH